MTIDEAIAHAKEKAKEQRSHIGTWDEEYSKRCEEYAKEHERIAEWLEELKRLRENANGYSKEDIELNRKAMYNKAIDDFAKKISLEISESIIWGMIVDWSKHEYMNDTSDKIVEYVIETSKEIAEQLKAGGENG